MGRPKIQILIKSIETELLKARDFAHKTKRAAQEIAKSAAASPSQSGDREHSKNQAEIAEDYLKNLEAAYFLIKTIQANIPQKVEGNVFIKLKFKDNRIENYYLVENPVKVTGLKLISTASPLGSALIGLSVGDAFSVNEPHLEGVILEIG